MKILILTNKPPFPPRDGSSLATSQLITGLSRQGHNLHVFFLNTSRHMADSKDIPADLPRTSFTDVPVNTRIRYIKALLSLLFSKQPYTVSRFITSESRKKLKVLLQKQSFDIIQFEGLSMAPYVSVVSYHTKAPVIFRPHNAEFLIWQRMAYAENNPFRKIYFLLLSRQIQKYEKKTAGIFKTILPISPEDNLIFRKWNPSALVLTIPYGLDIPPIKKESPSPPMPVLLFLGALDWLPNITGLLWFLKNVWPLLTRDIPGIRLKIAGRNPGEKLIRQIRLITKDPDGNHAGIDFLGEIDSTAIFYQSGSVFIVPLLAGGGIRIKILKAMAGKKAVVSTTIGATGIPVTSGHDIMIADQPETFIQAIKKLINNPGLFQKITENALFLLQEHFNEKRIIDNLDKFYRSL